MALIKCPECGNKISDKAHQCPNCGYPIILDSNDYECEECKNVYNALSKACPQCGAPTPRNVYIKFHIKEKKVIYIGVIAIISLIIISIGIIASKGKKDTITEIESKENIITETFKTNDKEEVELAVEQFINELNNGNLDKTQEYFTENYDYLDKCIYPLEEENTIKLLLQKTSFTIKDSVVDDNLGKAIVNFEVNHPSYDALLQAIIDSTDIFSSNNKSSDEVFIEKLNDTSLEYLTDSASLNLSKVNGEWKIINDATLQMFICYGSTGESSIQSITDNEIKVAEQEEYIKNHMELTEFIIEECEGYLGTVPGIRNVSLKNNGDRTVDTVELYLDFVDDSGKSIEKKTVLILGYMDDVLEPGYSWKMQNGTFIEIENLADGIDLSRVNVGIENITFKSTYTSSVKSEEEKYIEEYLELLDYKVAMCQSYSGKCPGLRNISIKNNGTKDIKELTVTVYFQDSNGKDIAEDSFLVIGGWGSSDELKANYSWKMQSDSFYEIENLADEVDISRYRLEISEISFS